MMSSVAEVAAGDFSRYAKYFSAAGYSVSDAAPGIIQIVRDPLQLSLVLSIGIHGNETAPIELVTHLLDTLAMQPAQLGVNLLVVVGNPAAIAQARRFVEVDLNRLFKQDQGDMAMMLEAARACMIMQASRAFFAMAQGPRWHLDLHTAIRPSRYPTFAILPHAVALTQKRSLLQLLGHAGIGAVILQRSAAATFSAFTAEHLQATSATLELGQISPLGSNDMTQFAAVAATLATLLRTAATAGTPRDAPIIFEVAQEIINTSESFCLHIDSSMPNFSPIAPGSIIATDGAVVCRVGLQEERIVFPNPAVRIGQRAGLMVVRGLLR